MILLWNRKEIFLDNSLQRFSIVRDTLSANGIKYEYKITDSTNGGSFFTSSRERSGTFGINMDYAKMYYIYVHKNDFENAQELLRTSRP